MSDDSGKKKPTDTAEDVKKWKSRADKKKTNSFWQINDIIEEEVMAKKVHDNQGRIKKLASCRLELIWRY